MEEPAAVLIESCYGVVSVLMKRCIKVASKQLERCIHPAIQYLRCAAIVLLEQMHIGIVGDFY